MAEAVTIEEFGNRVQLFLKLLVNELPAINVRAAKTGLSLLKNRIINNGMSSTGASLGKYSDNPLPPFFFKGNGISGSADKKLEKAAKDKKKKGVSYKDWREFNGLQTNHIDLQFSGDMWRDIDVVASDLKGDQVITTVTAKNSISRKSGKGSLKTEDIMEFNAERYGDFMALSSEEETELELSFDAELQKFLDETLGL